MQAISVIAQLKKKKPSAGYIIIRGYMHRKPVKAISTGYVIRPDHWDAHNRRVIDTAPNAELINVALQQKLQTIQAELLRREIAQQPIDKGTLAMIITGGNTSDFSQYAKKVIESKKLKDGDGYNVDTKRRYQQEINRLNEFQDPVLFKHITASFLERYKTWMQSDSMHPNSIWKALASLRMVWNEAIREKIIPEQNNPFKAFKVGRYKRDTGKIKYLQLHDIDAIESMLISRAKELELITLQIGWRFLFMCVSGLRISDAKLLNDQFLTASDFIEFRPYKTRRTDNKARIPIGNDRQKRYLQNTLSYALPEKKELNDFRSLFNTELRMIAQLAGISQPVTSHHARHTMGAFLVDGSVDNKAAKEILGVKTDEVMNTYLHLKQSKLISESKKLDGVF